MGFCTKSSDFTLLVHSPLSVEELAAKKAANVVRAHQKQLKLVSEILGSNTLSDRVTQIIGLLLDKHLIYLDTLTESDSINLSAHPGEPSAIDFLRSAAGRKFLISYIYKGFSSKSGPFSTFDTRLVRFAESHLQLLPDVCLFIDTGVSPSNEIIAKLVVSMAKAYSSSSS